MADLNSFAMSGKVKSMEEMTSKAGTGFVLVAIDCSQFERGKETATTYTFSFFRENKAAIMAAVAPGDLIVVFGKVGTNPRGYTDLRATSWLLVRKATQATDAELAANIPPQWRNPAPAPAYAPAPSPAVDFMPYPQGNPTPPPPPPPPPALPIDDTPF